MLIALLLIFVLLIKTVLGLNLFREGLVKQLLVEQKMKLFDQPVKKQDDIRKIASGQGDDYRT